MIKPPLVKTRIPCDEEERVNLPIQKGGWRDSWNWDKVYSQCLEHANGEKFIPLTFMTIVASLWEVANKRVKMKSDGFHHIPQLMAADYITAAKAEKLTPHAILFWRRAWKELDSVDSCIRPRGDQARRSLVIKQHWYIQKE